MAAKNGFTLADLQEKVQEALFLEPARGRTDNRVSPVPNARTIRYYTTLGLLEKPEVRSGQAYYGRRHLIKILAIKRLQAEGLTLNQAGEKLENLDSRALRSISKVPSLARLEMAGAKMKAERERFWSARPAPAPTGEPFTVLRGLKLAPGVTLTFETLRDLFPEDVGTLNAAAEPLIQALRERGLTP